LNPRAAFKYARLLPAVMAVSATLLALKIAGVADIARAQTAQAPNTQQASLAAPAAPIVSRNKDGDDAESSSAAEVDVLTSLSKRRNELDARGADLDMRENLIAAAEKRVDAKIATLKDLQTQIATLMGQRDTEQAKQIANLVKVYSDMKPRDAAQIFNTLSEEVLVPVANGMKPDALAPVMAQMQPEAAQRLTIRLANRLKLPATAAASAAPAPQAANTTPAPTSIAPAAPSSGG
jgi:flagellar motility protein MotE (MotC chaperone)